MASKKDDFVASEQKEEAKKSKKSDKKSDKEKKARKNPFKSIGAFFKGVKSEGKKVVWPKAKEVFKNTVIVLVVILIVGVVIYLIDLGLTQGMKGIKQLANTTTVAAESTEPTTAETLDENTEAESTEEKTSEQTTTEKAD
ncbi:MAG: preprotein translocase subunit SecE [Eubacterium sp.]|nr:preprotein translocase subunit SecE [Eubacterium sp.]MBR4240687.1 preprotein translocase subunit SecE [Eubacterium sp.]